MILSGRAQALALIDPPHCASITGAAPRRLTYAEADRAISVLATKLGGLGLQTDTVVAMQLANTVDSVIALLAIWRARLIAAPLPLLWRRQEMVDALSRAGAKAIHVAAHRRERGGRDRHAGGSRAVSDTAHLRSAHVVARRIAGALNSAMLAPQHGSDKIAANVTLTTLKAGDTRDSLKLRVMASWAVAAE